MLGQFMLHTLVALAMAIAFVGRLPCEVIEAGEEGGQLRIEVSWRPVLQDNALFWGMSLAVLLASS